MSNPVNTLGGAKTTGFVTVAEMPPHGMITLRGDFAAAKFKAAVKKAAGAAIPAQRKVAVTDKATLSWMSPDELLLVLPYDKAAATQGALAAELDGTHFLAENVSDARVMFQITGEAALIRELVAKLAPVDMSPEAFAVGDIRRTHLNQIAAAFWLEDDSRLNVVCFRSVARYLFDLLEVSAVKGSEVGLFA